VAGWRLGVETGRVGTESQKPLCGRAMMRLGAVPSDPSRRRARRSCVGLLAGPEGGQVSGDPAVILAGAVTLGPVPLGRRRPSDQSTRIEAHDSSPPPGLPG
jgi:hypothetical protein